MLQIDRKMDGKKQDREMDRKNDRERQFDVCTDKRMGKS